MKKNRKDDSNYLITMQDIQDIRAHATFPSITMCIPMEVAGNYEKNRIRWKNACQEMATQLQDQDIDDSFLRPAWALVDDQSFWENQSPGLMGFYAPGFERTIHLIEKPESSVMLANQFYMLPLLQQKNNNDRLYVLALGQNHVKFYEAVPSGIIPIDIDDIVPDNMEDALNLDIGDDQIQAHTAGAKSIYHSNDTGKENENKRLIQYFRQVDAGIMKITKGHSIPLVLAAVEHYHAIYESITQYQNFSKHMLVGNPQDLTPVQISSGLIPVFKDIQHQRIQTFKKSLEARRGADLSFQGMKALLEHLAMNNVAEIIFPTSYMNNKSNEDILEMNEVVLDIIDQGGQVHFDSQGHDNQIIGYCRFVMEESQ